MGFESVLFLFVAGMIVGGAIVYLLYARIAVVAARVEAEGAAAKKAYEDLSSAFKVLGAAPAAPAPASPVPPPTAGAPPTSSSAA